MVKTLAILWVAATSLQAVDPSLYGDWARGDGRARVRIEPCGADICAINTWIRPGASGEKIGDKLVMTIKPATPDKWVGKAFDPQRHLTYGMTIHVGTTTMTTQGCVLGGLICKTMDWARL